MEAFLKKINVYVYINTHNDIILYIEEYIQLIHKVLCLNQLTYTIHIPKHIMLF